VHVTMRFVVCIIGINYGGKIEKIIRQVNIGKLRRKVVKMHFGKRCIVRLWVCEAGSTRYEVRCKR
jgi:hypothetical protein